MGFWNAQVQGIGRTKTPGFVVDTGHNIVAGEQGSDTLLDRHHLRVRPIFARFRATEERTLTLKLTKHTFFRGKGACDVLDDPKSDKDRVGTCDHRHEIS